MTTAWGHVAEWLRRGLQILAPRFDSGRGLQIHTIDAGRLTILAQNAKTMADFDIEALQSAAALL
jgi:hypothetical protein